MDGCWSWLCSFVSQIPPPPHPHFPFLFLPSSQEFIPYSLTDSKFFLISFRDKSLLIGCRWITFLSNLQGDSWTGKREFWHLIRYGHLLCWTDSGLFVKLCAWAHQVIHLSRSALWASVVEGVTLPSTWVVYYGSCWNMDHNVVCVCCLHPLEMFCSITRL